MSCTTLELTGDTNVSLRVCHTTALSDFSVARIIIIIIIIIIMYIISYNYVLLINIHSTTVAVAKTVKQTKN